MGLSPFDHPFLSGLFEDAELAECLSASADISAMIAFEVALARAEADVGLIAPQAAQAILRLSETWVPDIGSLRAGVGRDGVVVPDLVRQMREALGDPHASALHLGATSQDVIDTSLVLRLKPIMSILKGRLDRLEQQLAHLAGRFGDRKLMGRTRMQDALEITVRDRLTDWVLPFARHRQRLSEMAPHLLIVQFGGAVGTREALGDRGLEVTRALARILELGWSEKAWHNQRDSLIAFANWLSLTAGSLGKIGQDVALMASAGDGGIRLEGGGTSSAMAHKSNPVCAEVLVALARYAAGNTGTIGHAMVHEQERSGAAWTLEWLVLPQMILATGSACLLAERLLGSIVELGYK